MSKTHQRQQVLTMIGLTVGILLLAESGSVGNRLQPTPNANPDSPALGNAGPEISTRAAREANAVGAVLDTSRVTVPPIPRAPAATSSGDTPAYYIEGPLALDPPTDRVFARGRIGDRPATLVLAAESGELLTSVEPVGEIAVDPERRRLYIDVLDRGLFSLDLDSLTRKAVVALPRPSLDFENRYSLPVVPIVQTSNGRVLIFRDRTVRVVDPIETGSVRTLRILDHLGVEFIHNAVLDHERDWLYLTALDRHIPAYAFGSRLIGYDLTRDEVVLAFGVMGSFVSVLAWDGRLWTLDETGRRPGTDSRMWRDGKMAEHVHAWNPMGIPNGRFALDRANQMRMLLIADRLYAFDLQNDVLRFVTPLLQGSASDPTLPTMNARRLLVRDGRLITLPARAVPAPGPRLSSPAPAPEYGVGALFPVTEDRVYALSRVASPSHPSALLLSRDMGQSWAHPGEGLPRSDNISDLAVSPDIARDRILFASTLGSGIFRSINGGRLWKPVPFGPDSRWIGHLSISPAFGTDRLIFASGQSSYFYDPGAPDGWGQPADTAWRSSDGGESWQGMGRLAGLALSPDFAHDRHMLAFRIYTGDLVESRDAGRNWYPAGQLPFDEQSGLMGVRLWALENPDGGQSVLLAFAADTLGFERMGFGPGRLYRSVDGGRHWTLVLDDPVQTIYSVESFLGPIGRDKRDLVIRLHQESPVRFDSSDAVYRSSDLGASWRLIGRAAQVQIAALSDGDLVFSNAESSIQRIRLDDLPAMLSQHLWRNQRFLPSIVQGH